MKKRRSAEQIVGLLRQADVDLGKGATVPYFFARRLTRELGIPVGIISIADGGTSIEAWSPREALEKIPYGRKALAYADSQAWRDFLKGGEERIDAYGPMLSNMATA